MNRVRIKVVKGDYLQVKLVASDDMHDQYEIKTIQRLEGFLKQFLEFL